MKRIAVIILIAAVVMIFAAGHQPKDDARLHPRLLNYQGFLTDTVGNPVTNPSVAMFFSIYDAVTGGGLKWSENQASVSVDRGIFHVLLGGVNPIPDSVFKPGADRWLELSIAGQVLAPRTRIVSVPYAYTATYSDTALFAYGSTPDRKWDFLVSDGADTTLMMGGRWGLARPGNMLFGNADSTHVNFGVACTTGATGINFKYSTVAGGYFNSASNRATVAGGQFNGARGEYSTIGGGSYNIAGGWTATISGGDHNTASNQYTFIGGGQSNTVSGERATVGGGYQNTAGGLCAFVGGGYQNSAPNQYAVVAGGTGNSTGGNYATIGGGSTNSAIYMGTVAGGFQNNASTNATIAGGVFNSASGLTSTVGGGYQNLASGTVATVSGGRYNKARGAYSVVSGGGGSNEADSNSAIGNYSTIGGGNYNIARGDHAFIGGGWANHAGGNSAAIGGGYGNTASGDRTVIGGGFQNTASDVDGVVGGGLWNIASGYTATICGGESNTVSGFMSSVCGGWWNTVTDSFAFIGVGHYNYNAGNYSAILGGYADTIFSNANYSYLFGINSNLTQDSTFMVDMPHVRFGKELDGYEFPTTDGTNGQALITNGNGQVSWGTPADADWTISGNNMSSAVSGNVGIGISSPTVRLEVRAGTSDTAAIFRGNLVIQSKATGNAVLELGEGLDYAEGFDVSQPDKIKPGTVLVIDPENPGKLAVSQRAYDTRVAGIVAGGKGLASGIKLGTGDFNHNVALAGRVYCNVDASLAAIEPGDLLTTADTPGYAMKVLNYDRAKGAILGKAMEPLAKGQKDQILVLVSLQ